MASSPDVITREKGERPFVTLLREIDKLKEKGLRRLRFTSPHPQDFSTDLIVLHNELDTLQPYIHLPVQSGSSKVLQGMRRTYTREHYLHLIKLIRQHIPDCAISTDIIVGFCGETEAEFEESYSMMEQVEWDMAFILQYSERPGTYGTKHLEDNVPEKEKKHRFQQLNEILHRNSRKKHAAFLEKTVEVLVEKVEPKKKEATSQENSSKRTKNGAETNAGETFRCSGRTPHFKEVFFDSGRDLKGQFVPVKITKTHDFFVWESRIAA